MKKQTAASNPLITDVMQQVEHLYSPGAIVDLKNGPYDNIMETHIQGIAYYRQAISGSDQYAYYMLFSANHSHNGSILVFDYTTGERFYSFDTPDFSYNHPGGMQIFGDYLCVPVEADNESRSHIFFYDLSAMSPSQAPRLLPYHISRDTKKAGAAGITRFSLPNGDTYYLLAVYDNGKLDIYQSNGQPIESTEFAFNSEPFSTRLDISSYSSVNLVTEQDTNNIYLLGFRSEEVLKIGDIGFYDEDHIDVYQITPDGSTIRVSDVLLDKHVVTSHSTRVLEWGVHFRFGGGVYINENTQLNVLASARSFIVGTSTANIFVQKSSVNTIPVTYAIADSHSHRISDNFDLTDDTTMIQWQIHGIDETIDKQKISFNLYRQRSSPAKDKKENHKPLTQGSITSGMPDTGGQHHMYLRDLQYIDPQGTKYHKQDAIVKLTEHSQKGVSPQDRQFSISTTKYDIPLVPNG